MDYRKVTVGLDRKLVNDAVTKSKKDNVAKNPTKLLRYLLHMFAKGDLRLNLSYRIFKLDRFTTMGKVDHEQIHAVRRFVNAKGFELSRDEVINVLFSNYLNNDKLFKK